MEEEKKEVKVEETTPETPVIDVKMDETIFKDLEQGMTEFVETAKEKESNQVEQIEKMDELLNKMIENENAAAEKAEADALLVEEVDPDAVDLTSIYKLMQKKMEEDAEAFNSFEYLACIEEVETEEVEGAEETFTLCEHLQMNNEKLDTLIEQNQIISFYGYIVIPGILITLFFYKVLKWFT